MDDFPVSKKRRLRNKRISKEILCKVIAFYTTANGLNKTQKVKILEQLTAE